MIDEKQKWPTDKKRYDANYERIFGRNATGGYICIDGDFAKDFKKAINGRKPETVSS